MTETIIALSPVALALLALAIGLAAGLFHFATLDRITRLYLQGDAIGRAVGLQIARLALLAAILTGLAIAGAAPLLLGGLGLLIGRAIVLRRKRGAA